MILCIVIVVCRGNIYNNHIKNAGGYREIAAAAAAAKSLQSCPTLCNPIDGSPLGSPVPGILKAIYRLAKHSLSAC